MTLYKLPLGDLHRALLSTVTRESGVWLAFNIGSDERPAMKWYALDTVQAIDPIIYDVAPNVYPRAVFIGVANGILERGKQIVDIRIVYATNELLARVA